jgi:hypothetical protein
MSFSFPIRALRTISSQILAINSNDKLLSLVGKFENMTFKNYTRALIWWAYVILFSPIIRSKSDSWKSLGSGNFYIICYLKSCKFLITFPTISFSIKSIFMASDIVYCSRIVAWLFNYPRTLDITLNIGKTEVSFSIFSMHIFSIFSF